MVLLVAKATPVSGVFLRDGVAGYAPRAKEVLVSLARMALANELFCTQERKGAPWPEAIGRQPAYRLSHCHHDPEGHGDGNAFEYRLTRHDRKGANERQPEKTEPNDQG